MKFNKNAESHKEVVSATKCVLEAAPTIDNKTLSRVIHNQFNEIDTTEIVRSIHLAIWYFNSRHASLKRNYKNLW